VCLELESELELKAISGEDEDIYIEILIVVLSKHQFSLAGISTLRRSLHVSTSGRQVSCGRQRRAPGW